MNVAGGELEEENSVEVTALQEWVASLAIPVCGARLDRFALARWFESRGDLEKSKRAIRRHLAFRIAESVDETKPEDLQSLIDRKVVLLGGPDNEGLPVMFVFVRRHLMKETEPGLMRKFTIFVIEELIKNSKFGTFSVVFDLQNYSITDNMDVKALLAFAKILQYNYPFACEKVWIVNAPWLFGAVYGTLIRPFLSTQAVELIEFLSSPEDVEEVIAVDRIPSDFYEFDEEEDDEEGDDDDEEEEEGDDDEEGDGKGKIAQN